MAFNVRAETTSAGAAPAEGDAVRLLAAVRTLPAGPGDVGTVVRVIGHGAGGALLAVDVAGCPLPVVLFEDEVELL